MHLTGLDSFLWAASLFAHLLLLLVLWFRSRVREFPVFTTLIAFNVLRSLVLYLTLRLCRPKTYFIAYWSISVLDVGLQLAVVGEIASHVFRPLGVWSSEVRRGFLLLFGMAVLVACILAWLAAPTTRSTPETIVLRGSLLSSALMGELFVGMSVLSMSMGLPWKTHVARIAQGFGAFSLVDIVIEGLNNYWGVAASTEAYTALAHLRILSYIFCVVYWILMLAREAPEPKELPDALRRQLFFLQARLAQDLQLLRTWKS